MDANRKGIGAAILAGLAVWTAAVGIANAVQLPLAWSAPETTLSGATIAEPVGYRVFYGFASGEYQDVRDVGTATSVVLEGLDPAAVYYISVVAYTASGSSDYASEIVWSYDANSDQVADSWQRQALGGLDVLGAAPDEDPDHDGAPNLMEFVAGTVPTDSDSRPDVRIELAGGAVDVTFQTQAAQGPGYLGRIRHYTLEQCSDLALADWAPVAGFEDLIGDTPTTTVAAVASAPAAGNFRVRIWLE